ncbi:MAG: PorV/PorQ family protein [Bacteroidota bacterium]
MKTIYRNLIVILIVVLILPLAESTFAGNKDRSGQAGATELLINPWARSSGWASANMSRVRGLEAIWGNVAGTAFTPKTQLIFSNTQWLKGTGTNIMSFGLSQRVGEAGALTLSVMSMSFGEIDIKTVENPDDAQGTYSPSLMNIAIGYAKAFSNSIYAGVVVKVISESISDVSAVGVAIDAGIQYVTGADEQISFGIALKNVGPKMMFTGDGLSMRTIITGQETSFTVDQRSMAFEIPAQLNIGAAYDFLFPKDYRLTLAGNFTSNSFTQDQFAGGLEFSLKDYVMIRGGYTYEKGMFEEVTSADNININNGISAGLSVQVPLKKEKGSFIGIDYTYRESQSFSGNHTFGVIFNF